MMTLFWPRVRKENVKRRNRRITNHIFKNFKRIVLDNIKIFQLLCFNFTQKFSNAGSMNFDSNIIYIRIFLCKKCRCRSHSKTDFNHYRICISKNFNIIYLFVLIRNAINRRKFLIIPQLSLRHPSNAENISFYRAVYRFFFKILIF